MGGGNWVPPLRVGVGRELGTLSPGEFRVHLEIGRCAEACHCTRGLLQRTGRLVGLSCEPAEGVREGSADRARPVEAD